MRLATHRAQVHAQSVETRSLFPSKHAPDSADRHGLQLAAARARSCFLLFLGAMEVRSGLGDERGRGLAVRAPREDPQLAALLLEGSFQIWVEVHLNNYYYFKPPTSQPAPSSYPAHSQCFSRWLYTSAISAYKSCYACTLFFSLLFTTSNSSESRLSNCASFTSSLAPPPTPCCCYYYHYPRLTSVFRLGTTPLIFPRELVVGSSSDEFILTPLPFGLGVLRVVVVTISRTNGISPALESQGEAGESTANTSGLSSSRGPTAAYYYIYYYSHLPCSSTFCSSSSCSTFFQHWPPSKLTS